MAEKKKALGRGIAALMGETAESVPARPIAAARTGDGAEISENTIVYIDIDDIRPNRTQPRTHFDEGSIEELALSIGAHGILQPVILRKTDFGYELVAGERRWRAARKAGLRAVPSIVRSIGEEENALIALIENVQREDLNAAEEAVAFSAIIGSRGLTQEELAAAVGKSRSYIANTIRILKLPKKIVEYIREGMLTAGHANALGMLKNEEKQLEAAKIMVKKGLSVREAERLCSEDSRERRKPSRPKREDTRKSRDMLAVEEELTSSFGTRVVIVPEKRGGKIELHYYNRDGLEELIELLRKNA
jgi:ParB family chromosome partitioning protein